MKIYGPYIRKEDGRKIIIEYDGKKRTGKLYAKYLLEKKLNRKLNKEEEVDHIDGDKTNDDINNLRCLTGTKNRQLAAIKKYGERVYIPCNKCKKLFSVSFNKSIKIKKNKLKKFCSLSCRSKFFGNQYQR